MYVAGLLASSAPIVQRRWTSFRAAHLSSKVPSSLYSSDNVLAYYCLLGPRVGIAEQHIERHHIIP